MLPASSLILVASANPSSWHRVKEALAGSFTVAFAVDLQGTLDLLQRHRPAALVLGPKLLDASLEQAFARLGGKDTPVLVILGADGDDSSPYAAAAACLQEHEVKASLLGVIQRLLGGRPGNARDEEIDEEMVVGGSEEMRRLVDTARSVAPLDVDILLEGETGTGKEVLARWIHQVSHRARGPFETVDLPAVPAELFESILFGHERGSFTGAVTPTQGKFQRARKGTLFLDEIASLKLELQPKLLRAIQHKQVESVGGTGPTPCDVRIIAATNLDLARAVKRGEFRADLYYRLNVVTLRLSPLRERKQDIPQLVQRFSRKHARRLGCPEPAISDEMLGSLVAHDWPGNIRELEHWVQRAVVLGRCGPLRPQELLPEAAEEPAEEGSVCFGRCTHSLEQIEQMYIERVLELADGNQSKAAQLLQIDRKTLRAKLQKYAEQGSTAVLRSVS